MHASPADRRSSLPGKLPGRGSGRCSRNSVLVRPHRTLWICNALQSFFSLFILEVTLGVIVRYTATESAYWTHSRRATENPALPVVQKLLYILIPVPAFLNAWCNRMVSTGCRQIISAFFSNGIHRTQFAKQPQLPPETGSLPTVHSVVRLQFAWSCLSVGLLSLICDLYVRWRYWSNNAKSTFSVETNLELFRPALELSAIKSAVRLAVGYPTASWRCSCQELLG